MTPEQYNNLLPGQREGVLMSAQCDPLDHLPTEDSPAYLEELSECYLTPPQIAHGNYEDLPKPYQRAVLLYDGPVPA